MTLLFEVQTPLGFSVRCTRTYWNAVLLEKHPILRGREHEVRDALADPDQVRRSSKDLAVLLFYRGGPARWMCAVARRVRAGGFLVTAYPTDAIKIGETVWTRSS